MFPPEQRAAAVAARVRDTGRGRAGRSRRQEVARRHLDTPPLWGSCSRSSPWCTTLLAPSSCCCCFAGGCFPSLLVPHPTGPFASLPVDCLLVFPAACGPFVSLCLFISLCPFNFLRCRSRSRRAGSCCTAYRPSRRLIRSYSKS